MAHSPSSTTDVASTTFSLHARAHLRRDRSDACQPLFAVDRAHRSQRPAVVSLALGCGGEQGASDQLARLVRLDAGGDHHSAHVAVAYEEQTRQQQRSAAKVAPGILGRLLGAEGEPAQQPGAQRRRVDPSRRSEQLPGRRRRRREDRRREATWPGRPRRQRPARGRRPGARRMLARRSPRARSATQRGRSRRGGEGRGSRRRRPARAARRCSPRSRRRARPSRRIALRRPRRRRFAAIAAPSIAAGLEAEHGLTDQRASRALAAAGAACRGGSSVYARALVRAPPARVAVDSKQMTASAPAGGRRATREELQDRRERARREVRPLRRLRDQGRDHVPRQVGGLSGLCAAGGEDARPVPRTVRETLAFIGGPTRPPSDMWGSAPRSVFGGDPSDSQTFALAPSAQGGFRG